MVRGRKKKQVNMVAAERVGIILDELKKAHGITQAKFAKAIYSTQQNVFKLKNGETDVSIEYAQAISRAYPQYRWEWILGLDDLKSPLDESRSRLERIMGESDKHLVLFKLLADLRGWDVQTAGDYPTVADGDATESHGLMLANYATLTRDGSTVTLDRVKFDKLISRMLGIFDVEIQNA